MSSLSATVGIALDDLSRQGRSLRRSFSVAHAGLGWVIWVTPAIGVRMIRSVTRDMAAVHLKGLRYRDLVARLLEDPEILDADFSMVDGLQGIKDRVLKIRASALELAVQFDKARRLAPVAAEARKLAAASAECYATLSEVQSEVQEHDADYSARLENATVGNLEDVEAMLSRLAALQ